jgi:hypothetical protein
MPQALAVESKGECELAPTFCGGFAGIPCPDGQACVDDPSDDCDPTRVAPIAAVFA